jgi:sulfoxide reductase catalytic subunit YedY
MDKKLKHVDIPSSEITPKELYLSRRDWLKMAGIFSATALLAACAPQVTGTPVETASSPQGGAGATSSSEPTERPTDELGDKANTFDQIVNYNNYYEFSTDKQAVNPLSANFKPSPWAVEVGGLVNKPKTYAIEDLLKFEQVERVYRLRCVEAWSMVIPWTGFELNKLLAEVEPMTSAKYVKFTTLMDTDQFPGQTSPFYPWPYTEGLRLDEAMHRLTLLVTGMYGETLPNPTGAPLRMAVPWKYGFKSIKAIVKIELTEEQPATMWNAIAPNEYGFYSNVNPEVDHPRWSQRTERRIGEPGRRDTLMFNGYEAEVASLYSGMDLRENY